MCLLISTIDCQGENRNFNINRNAQQLYRRNIALPFDPSLGGSEITFLLLGLHKRSSVILHISKLSSPQHICIYTRSFVES